MRWLSVQRARCSCVGLCTARCLLRYYRSGGACSSFPGALSRSQPHRILYAGRALHQGCEAGPQYCRIAFNTTVLLCCSWRGIMFMNTFTSFGSSKMCRVCALCPEKHVSQIAMKNVKTTIHHWGMESKFRVLHAIRRHTMLNRAAGQVAILSTLAALADVLSQACRRGGVHRAIRRMCRSLHSWYRNCADALKAQQLRANMDMKNLNKRNQNSASVTAGLRAAGSLLHLWEGEAMARVVARWWGKRHMHAKTLTGWYAHTETLKSTRQAQSVKIMTRVLQQCRNTTLESVLTQWCQHRREDQADRADQQAARILRRTQRNLEARHAMKMLAYWKGRQEHFQNAAVMLHRVVARHNTALKIEAQSVAISNWACARAAAKLTMMEFNFRQTMQSSTLEAQIMEQKQQAALKCKQQEVTYPLQVSRGTHDLAHRCNSP